MGKPYENDYMVGFSRLKYVSFQCLQQGTVYSFAFAPLNQKHPQVEPLSVCEPGVHSYTGALGTYEPWTKCTSCTDRLANPNIANLAKMAI